MGTEKPEYRVPTMTEIEAIEPNGYKVVSTFSGCGGSCLGFRMAGFKILWATEFVERAREVYMLNSPGTYLDHRDVRAVTAPEILARLGLGVGDLDVLEGSPPCASFSTAGNREKDWGKVKSYSTTKQRTDDLFFEFVRLLDGLKPRAFVAENVKGLVIGSAKGYFVEIHRALRACGYRVAAKVLDAQWLGVPQTRARTIFVGFRDDLGLDPRDWYPSPLPYRYSVADACPWITNAVHDTSGLFGAGDITHRPAPAITVGVNSLSSPHFKVKGELDDPLPPSMEGTALHRDWLKLAPGEASEKYINHIKASPEAPSPCVTASAGSRAGTAGVTHPFEPRKFTIAELRRICAFPDDFKLTGTYAEQWERLGRAVPPLMMRAVAERVRDALREVDARG